MGTHVHPWLIHVNVWQKTQQYCKVISLQLKLINVLKIIHLKKFIFPPVLQYPWFEAHFSERFNKN